MASIVLSESACRQSLLRRLDTTPSCWNHDDIDVLACVGEIHVGADACICALVCAVELVLATVKDSAEAERQRLELLRAMLHATMDKRIDDLLAMITRAESTKVNALELQLVRLDDALGHTRRELADVRHDLVGESDDELTVAHLAELASRLDSIDATLSTLPRGPVEPSLLRLEFDAASLISAIRTAGTVLAPCSVAADFVFLQGLPASARPGLPLQFELALSDDYPCRAPAELEAAATSIALLAHVSVSLASGVALPVHQPEQVQLRATLVPPAPNSASSNVVVTVDIPGTAVRGNEVVIRRVTMAGQPVFAAGLAQPALVPVTTGMLALLRLLDGVVGTDISLLTPTISPDGTLYNPRLKRLDVPAYAWDGAPLAPLLLAPLGLSNYTTTAAFGGDANTLLLGECHLVPSSKMVSVNAATGVVRWSATVGDMCGGIGVLPAAGVAIISDNTNSALHVHRLSDGVRIASAYAVSPYCVAANPATNTAYVSTGRTVSAFRWDGHALVAEGIVEAAGSTKKLRPLVVVPPAPGHWPGGARSFLVVGSGVGGSVLRILSLPDRRLVHTHTLGGMQIVGLAADPSGNAIAVCDAAVAGVYVLPWPLVGMSESVPLPLDIR